MRSDKKQFTSRELSFIRHILNNRLSFYKTSSDEVDRVNHIINVIDELLKIDKQER